MQNVIYKFKRYHKEYGFFKTLTAVLFIIFSFFGYRSNISKFKKKIGKKIIKFTDSKVYSGLYKEMYLDPYKSWDRDDSASMYLGVYEKHIQEKLFELGSKNKVFIDIGAADGFHAIGLIKSGAIKKSICFEISKKGQQIIKRNAALNNLEKFVEIFGEANFKSLESVMKKINNNALILIDIEGGEYELINDELINLLRESSIVIELHDFYSDYREKSKKMLDKLSRFFNIEYIEPTSINPNLYPILNNFPDDEKYLAFSESRPHKMRWILLTPRID